MLKTVPCLGRTTSKCRGNLQFNMDEKQFYIRASWHMHVTTVKFHLENSPRQNRRTAETFQEFTVFV